MNLLNTGEVIELPAGMKVYHNQEKGILELQVPVVVVVENSRKVLPFQSTGVEAHFEECWMVKARALNVDGTYHPEGALLTFAQYGDFRPEFILPGESNQVLRRMKQTFLSIT